MVDNSDYLQLVRQAQLGDGVGLNLLSQRVRGELSTYIYRITLDFDLTEDISQETLLEMVQAIKSLKDSRCFKSWLFRIASTKIKDHYRIRGNKRIMNKTTFDADKLLQYAEQKPDALGRLLKDELSHAISAAMAKLKHNYRNVLVLRCFEQMSYSDIAYTMGCSSIEAQLLFFRAKHSLKKQLQTSGYKKEHLLSSLGLFAGLTALPFKTASASTVTVAPAAMKVGALASVIGAMTTKTGIIATVIAAAAIATFPTTMSNKNPATAASSVNFHIISQEQAEQTMFNCPSVITASFNPKDDRWEASRDSDHIPIPVSLEQWLTQVPLKKRFSILIPEKGWISMRFSSPIVDGPGDDIIIVEKCKFGEKADVFLADNNNNETYIGTINVPPLNDHTLTFFASDISKLDLSFTPTTIRILATDAGEIEYKGALPGFDLVSVWANLSD
ncbi:MAG: RNA polymerase sigma factor [Phycisphaerae bacterium]|jgi:RNA polymerase sigma-70 factor (ECF subfamily)